MKFEIDPNELTTDQRAHVAAFITNWPIYSDVSNLLKEILDAPETEEFKMAKRAGGIAGARNLSEEQRLDAEQKSELREISGAEEAYAIGAAQADNLNAIFGTPVDTAGDLTLTISATDSLVPLDSQGLPWDSRIHASTKTFIADGSWKLRRGVDPISVDMVKHQLKELMSVPTAPAPPTPVIIPQLAEIVPPISGPVGVPKLPSTPAPVLTPTSVGYVPPVPVPGPKSHYLIDQVPAAVTLTDLIGRMSAAIAAGKLTQASIAEICTKHGVSEFHLLSNRPDLLPLIDADMKAMGV